MARERFIFFASFILLSLIAAFLFRHDNTPEKQVSPPAQENIAPEKPVEPKKEEAMAKFKSESLPLAEGKIAVPYEIKSGSAIVQFLAPGMFVDIIFTSNPNIGPGTISLTLFKHIRIINIGRDPEGKNVNAAGGFNASNGPIEILLEMTPKESELFSYSVQAGTLSFVFTGDNTPKEDSALVKKLYNSKTDENFNSILVTHLIKNLFPKANIKVIATNKGYILKGSVPNQETAEKIVKTLTMLASDGDKAVINLIEEEQNQVEVLVAEKELHKGEHINRKDYKWKKIDARELDPSIITRTSQTEKWLDESIVARGVQKGHIFTNKDITWQNDLDEEQQTEFLSPEPGKVDVYFKINSRKLAIQSFTPGTYVNVKFSSKLDLGFGTETLTLLKNIRILAVKGLIGSRFRRDDFLQNENELEIFLEMTPREAEIFSYAVQWGNISIELENNLPEKNIELTQMLLTSESASDFHSFLITHMIRSLFPLVDIKFTSTPRGYIVEGNIPDPQMSEKIMEILFKLVPGGDRNIVNLMEVEPQQVLLCVKVMEIQKSLTRRLGINWKALFNNDGTTFAFASVFPSPGPLDPNYYFSGKGLVGNLTLSALLDMLEEDGFSKIIAEPNLTTVSGRTAHFFAGGEFPILIPQGGLIGAITVEFKKYGVLLDFTPYVDLNGLITLQVTPEVSNLDKNNSVSFNGFIIPALLSRRVDTMVKLWPGQSYIIAGMYLNQLLYINDNLFGLNKVPIIGPLFSSKRSEEQKKELAVVVTPYLISNGAICEYPRVGRVRPACEECETN